jgi:hypothetical protein
LQGRVGAEAEDEGKEEGGGDQGVGEQVSGVYNILATSGYELVRKGDMAKKSSQWEFLKRAETFQQYQCRIRWHASE